ncbi:MAG TPA: YraN family protein [Candidatus Saccharimonadales bacterium]|nr:YraN family protein [Candidatus Saccharimonadales bacterium]
MKIVNPTAILGEDIATKYLQKSGYKIIERNFRKGYGEIDIVAVKDNTLVFIEVKTRTSNKFGTPGEAITYWKLKSLIKTAQFYKMTHRNLPEALRIDAVSVKLLSNNEVEDIEHIQNISGF